MPRQTITKFIKDIKGYGFTALAAAAIAIGFIILGQPVIAAFAFGVFITRNYDIIMKYLKEELNLF